ncbi:MAG: choice-of-anchor L domain-containing protein [Flavobacteriales bacterium]|nr:choice-of-anchor L domain-containing protein [Flavobacteriales bacterium]
MKKLLPFLLITLFSSSIYGQLQVTSNMTVSQYVQDVLLGVNVTVSNITYNGGSADVAVPCIGSFDSNGSMLPIESGFLMSSGNASAAPGPNNTNAASDLGLDFGNDPDLMAITDDALNDWSIIEFDFVPLGDTLRFNYIWASEEYPEYSNGSVNDVFGFFISGPGINGTFTNNGVNIALIPGTDLPVSINNLNNGQDGVTGPCAYCEFYNGNGQGFDTEDPTYTDPFTIVYDGYTDKLTAIGIVQCGLTYHIKLAICDGGDGIYDSAVFLERDSFSSNLVVQANLELDVAGPDGQTLFENCGDGNLVFERPESGNVNTPLVAYLGYSGTAINGVDYTLMPDSVVFPARGYVGFCFY